MIHCNHIYCLYSLVEFILYCGIHIVLYYFSLASNIMATIKLLFISILVVFTMQSGVDALSRKSFLNKNDKMTWKYPSSAAPSHEILHGSVVLLQHQVMKLLLLHQHLFRNRPTNFVMLQALAHVQPPTTVYVQE